jgi:hypothetical protein
MKKREVLTMKDQGVGAGALEGRGETSTLGTAESQGTTTEGEKLTSEIETVTTREIAVGMTIEIGIGEVDETTITDNVDVAIKHVKMFNNPFSAFQPARPTELSHLPYVTTQTRINLLEISSIAHNRHTDYSIK